MEIASNDGYLLQHFVAAGVPVLRHRAGRQRGARSPSRRACRRRSSSSARSTARRDRAQSTAGRPAARQQRARARARPQRLRRRHEDPAQAERRHHDGVPASAAAHGRRTSSTRSTTSTSRYFSFCTVEQIFAHARPDAVRRRGAADARRVAAHLRLPRRGRGACRSRRAWRAAQQRERARAATTSTTYAAFGEQVKETKRKLLEFLIDAKRPGKTVVGYGAPGKGNTLLNYCGIRTDFLDYTVDRSPLQAGQVHCPARTSRSSRRSRSARRGPTTC